MTANAYIVVTGGLHAGASVALPADRPLQIGSGNEADLMVLDEGVEPLHATVQLHGAALSLVARQPRVTVFGRPLPPGRRVLLQHGAWFSAGTAAFRFGGRDAANPSSVTASATAAERAYLLRHAPLAYCAKRWHAATPATKATVFAAPLAFALLAWLAAHPVADTPHPAPVDARFRLVTQRADPKSGALVYEGYVQSPADLAALTAQAWSRQRAPVMHVVVLAQLQDQLGDFLARYYRGAQLRPAAAGSFDALLPGAQGFLSPESWDYARVAKEAQRELDGLRELGFPGHAQSGAKVRVPLEALGMNLLASDHVVWLTDAQGVRYFAGARLPGGRITRISACVAELTRDDGSIYEFFTSTPHGPDTCR